MAAPLIPWNMSTMVEAEGSGSRTGGWTLGQDKAFEIALTTVDKEEGEAAWNKIADAVEGKTAEEVKQRYELPVEDVDAILAGSVPLPVYADDDWLPEEGCFGDWRKGVSGVGEGQGGFGYGRKGVSRVGEGQGGFVYADGDWVLEEGCFGDGRKGVSGVGEGHGGFVYAHDDWVLEEGCFGDGRKGVSGVGEGQGGFVYADDDWVLEEGCFGDGRKGVSGLGEGQGGFGDGRKGVSGVGEGQGGFSDVRKGVSGVGEGQGGFLDGRKGVSVVGEGQGGFGDGRKGISQVGEGQGRHGEKGPFKSVKQGRRKGNLWTEDEHRLFLLGLEKYGKGDWRSISRNFVISRTPTQVASHAQKYFIRLNSMNRERRRSSIHDITSVNGEASAAQGPITGTNGQAAVPGKSPKQSPQPGTLPPGVDAFGTTIGQPVGGPLVSAVGTPVTLPVPAPPHMGYAMHAPVPGTVVPRPPMYPMPPPPSR